MLGVDELSKAGREVKTLLKYLTSKLDLDDNLFLSVSAYGCVDLSKFATDSRRMLLFQPLPPIFTANAWDHYILPPLLRMFADASIRKTLNFGNEDKAVYARLSRLILASGGHPRRVEYLLKGLWQFKLPVTDFTSSLKAFLDDKENAINVNMNSVHLSTLESFPLPDLESLAKDCAKSFEFPNDFKSTESHQTCLQGTLQGSCSYIPGSDGKGHAFLPMPVLKVFPEVTNAIPYPCAYSLFLLTVYFDQFSKLDTDN